MRPLSLAAAVLLSLALGSPFQADDKSDDGYHPMFNGKDLTGWVNVNCAPSTFFVRDGEIITTGQPTGYLRTEKQYENFIVEFDWMHMNTKKVGNSGFFVWADPLPAVGTPYSRAIEVQVLVNLTYRNKKGEITATSQGDLFSIWGAHCKPDRPHPDGWERCLPSENRTKGGGEWNHYKVVGNNGTIKLHVNGKEVSGVSQVTPRKGYLALESEGAECHFKNLKIKELPSTNPTPAETANVDQGFKNLYTGLDLSGWTGEDVEAHWKPRDWVLHYDGKGKELRSAREYGDSEFMFDFRTPSKDSQGFDLFLHQQKKDEALKVTIGRGGLLLIKTNPGIVGLAPFQKVNLRPSGQWNRLHARLGEGGFSLKVNDEEAMRLGKLLSVPESGALVLHPREAMDFGNLFVRELKK